jgi:hypothetical protein
VVYTGTEYCQNLRCCLTGTKQLCNSNAWHRSKWSNLHRRIRNFAIPTVAAAAEGGQGNFIAKNAVLSVYTITPVTPYDDINVRLLGIRSERVLSNIFSDIDVWTFQSKAGSTTNIGGAFAAAQITGFNDQVVKFSGTTTLIATFNQVTKGFN